MFIYLLNEMKKKEKKETFVTEQSWYKKFFYHSLTFNSRENGLEILIYVSRKREISP